MRKLLAAYLVFPGATVWATEYFVSKERPDDSGAKFLGFTVDGEQLPADRLTYEISGDNPDGIIEITANYLPIGLKMVLR
jgi:hypothetical protein